MDEKASMIIAYSTMLFGLPILAAKITWFVPGSILAVVLAQVSQRLDKFIDAVVEGFISLLFACLVFEHLNIQIASAVPITLIMVNLFWNGINEGFFNALPSMVGIIVGFLLYPKVLPQIQLASIAFIQRVF
jgi:hypothetical protein